MGQFTRGEVVFLLSLSERQAIDLSIGWRDSCAGLQDDTNLISGTGDGQGVPIIARWVDVQRARRAIIRAKEGLAINQLKAGGYSEEELAGLSGRHRLALRRRWQATVEEILDRLGGEGMGAEGPTSRVSLCLSCGERPRARLRAVRRRVKGGWQEIEPERQAGVCPNCLTPELHHRIIGELALAA